MSIILLCSQVIEFRLLESAGTEYADTMFHRMIATRTTKITCGHHLQKILAQEI
ncbi:hypothetical protein Plhal304r1_c017g0061841 [Plasmopara halstedii]